MEKSTITLSRQYGSGGRAIGAKLAKELGLPFYDKDIISLSARQSGVTDDFFEQAEQTGGSLFRDFSASFSPDLPLGDKVYFAQCAAIRTLAQDGPCVMVGRGAGVVLEGVCPLLNVFVYADLETRKRRALEEYGDDPRKIEARIAAIDKKRAAYVRFYAGVDGRQLVNYHLCVDSGRVGIDGAVAAIAAAYRAL
ncbi:MAG: cytidylate kinase-like family protein [Oscillospiraceae bacterium]